MTEQIQVAVELGGHAVPAGTLYVATGRTLSSSFVYANSYLTHPDAYELDPALPLNLGTSHVLGLPGAFTDAAPDRWGRNLIRRRLTALDALGGRDLTDLRRWRP